MCIRDRTSINTGLPYAYINTIILFNKKPYLAPTNSSVWKYFAMKETTINHIENRPIVVSVYPNPMKERTVFEFNNPNKEECALVIFDNSGKKVVTEKEIFNNKIFVKRNNLNAGIYFYSLIKNNKVIATGKLEIQ